MNLKDVRAEGKYRQLSLSKLCGRQIKDIRCTVTTELGDPTIKLGVIEFTDGSRLKCEGEHDLPYLTTSEDVKVLPDDATLLALHKEIYEAD